MTDPAKPPRKFPTGEAIGLGALIISGLGLWNSWRSDEKTGPTEVVERKVAVPLVLRADVAADGKSLSVAPVDSGHALDSLALAFPGGKAIETGAGGRISAGDVEDALGDDADRAKDGQVVAKVTARYVEHGAERSSTRNYAIRYRWEGGGLFSNKSLRLVDFRRA